MFSYLPQHLTKLGLCHFKRDSPSFLT